ncbi:hypothetical protein PCASD_16714 [Puccinia coronata f. sp. avenae]|uniref:Uncharacterized protein n=1 Tax=Puccinia coronata f. sp. avenae TaxID=200324 RepID=A0A2N5SW82_9BASI|nr:hypothetical protein PCASD_16714 [Puccinia coronata f. sp. avenae]
MTTAQDSHLPSTFFGVVLIHTCGGIHSAGIWEPPCTCRNLRVSCLPSSRRRPVVAQGLGGCGLDTGETPPSACVPPSKTGKGKAPRDGGRFLGWWEGAKNLLISSRHEPADDAPQVGLPAAAAAWTPIRSLLRLLKDLVMTLKQEARRSIALSDLRMMQLCGGCGANWCPYQECGQWGGFREGGLSWFNGCSLRLGHRTVSEAATYGQDINGSRTSDIVTHQPASSIHSIKLP